ncbi:MAG: DUF2339 domain-containing protein, partial [Bradyrhizobium sp.]
MFDSPLDFFALVIALVAFIFARKAMNQAAALRMRLEAIEAIAAAGPVPPPLTPVQELEQAPVTSSPGLAAEPPALPTEAEAVAPAAVAQPTAGGSTAM